MKRFVFQAGFRFLCTLVCLPEGMKSEMGFAVSCIVFPFVQVYFLPAFVLPPPAIYFLYFCCVWSLFS